MKCFYGETWNIKDDVKILDHTEKSLMRWRCKDILRDGPASGELRSRSGTETINEVVRTGILHCFGHMERKD